MGEKPRASIIHRTFISTRNSVIRARPPLKHSSARLQHSGVTHDTRSAAKAFVATLVTARMNAVMVVSLSGSLNHHARLGKNPFFSPMHSPLLPFREYMPRGGLNRCVCKSLQADKVGGQGTVGPEVIRRPIVSTEAKDGRGGSDEGDGENEGEEERGKRVWEGGEDEEGEGEGVDWEDKILEDTVPLVGFVRMVLHSGEYGSGDRLKPEHERTITEKLLPYHPEAEKKIGCGIDYITVGYHPDFEGSRCLFVVRKDREMVDFSYWKCIKGLIRKKYPLHADSFILRHFRRRRSDGDRR